jgi:hypothetical protein
MLYARLLGSYHQRMVIVAHYFFDQYLQHMHTKIIYTMFHQKKLCCSVPPISTPTHNIHCAVSIEEIYHNGPELEIRIYK